MNRLRSNKFKPTTPEAINTTNSNCSSSTANTGSTSLLNKLSKRYSTLSNKITRKNATTRRSNSPQKPISGSYDMTGANSEDHRLEIGAPILISTTTLDTDRLDVSEARLKQIGGGIAVNGHSVIILQSAQSSPQIPSSGSENEIFVDALSTPPVREEQDEYEMAFETLKPSTKTLIINDRIKDVEMDPPPPPPNSNNLQMSNYYEVPKVPRPKSRLNKRQHSKSAQHLNRSNEVKVFIQKAPSVEFNMTLALAEMEKFQDVPRLPELFGASIWNLTPTNREHHDENNDKENIAPSVQSKSEPNTPVCPEQPATGFLSEQQQQHFKSVDSLDIHRNAKRRSVIFSSDASIDQHGSKTSLVSHSSTIADFNMKSVSCHSLNAQNLFVSIDELNEITQQINESEEFNREIDLEYCVHRDNLKPSERRITLLKNKNARLISFHNNKEKIKKGWTGVKHWIGEESSKFKEVVQKQSGTSKVNSESVMNLSNTTEDQHAIGTQLRRNNQDEGDANTNSTFNLGISCDNIATGRQNDNADVGDLESSITHRQGDNEDNSPEAKSPRREGQNGFEELRRYIKQGGDFGKELIFILQERVEAELLYSKSLSKMATKLNKACRELPGSIADAWRGVATEMESRSDIHRQLSASLTEELVRPLKTIVESHHKTRKSVESNVDKAARVLAEWRVSEAKAKKASHTAARENEKLQDAMLDVRIQKSPSIALLHQGPNKVAAEKEIKSAEKDCAKLDNKRKKAEEAVKRADVEYYTLCVRAERARVDWEMAVLRGSSLLQNIENQRLMNMKNFVTNYTRLTTNMNPILEGLMQRLQPQIDACNVLKDMQVVKNIRRNSEGPSEQLLPDFYCEHTTLAMNRERRKHALIKLLQLVKSDLERERRSRNGLKGLSQSLNNKDNQNITDKLYHIRSMLTYLEGSRFKLQSALLELDHKPRSSHPLAQHIQITRDRTGLQQSILKVPLWLKNNDNQMSTSGDESMLHDSSEYDCMSSEANTSSNVSCNDISKDMFIRNFNRSKSNIETFSSSNTQICLTNANKQKTKTIPTNLHDDPYSDRGQADGGSNQQDSDFDEFSSQDDDDTDSEHRTMMKKIIVDRTKITTGNGTDNQYQNATEAHEQHQSQSQIGNSTTTTVLSRCKALYSYTPKLYDELELNPGDIIEVHAKQDDGWWLGALRNQVGIFPATYVEEFA